MNEHQRLQATIEERLAGMDPEVEVIALEQPGRERLRLYIDTPGGVDLALCEQVTNELRELLERYALEVSSPGLDRPLTKPEHFRQFLGRTARVRTMQEIEGSRNFTGTLTDADETSVSLGGERGPVRIPLKKIRRANLVPEEQPLRAMQGKGVR